MKHKVLLIGLDGATFDILNPLMENGVMPYLKKFLKLGTYSPLRSTIPPLTPPAWTSLVTGQNPGKHGIFDFFQKVNKTHSIRLNTSKDVHSESIWSIVSKNNDKVNVLNFPLMLPVPEVNGNVIAGGWITKRQLPLACYPENLFGKLKTIPGFNPDVLALDMAHEEKAIEGCKEDEYEQWITLHINREKQWFSIAKYLMENDPSNLTAIMFDGVDKIQHLCWRFLSFENSIKEFSSQDKHIRDLCFKYFRLLDSYISEMVALAGEDTTVVMASDHGFGEQKETFFVNSWLHQQGFLQWKKDSDFKKSETSTLGFNQLSRHMYAIDWEHTKAYASTPSSNGIHIVTKDLDHPDGVSEDEYQEWRNGLIESLYAVTSPSHGSAMIKNIWKREDVFNGKFMEIAPDLTLNLIDGGLISILNSEKIISLNANPTGSHRFEGVFLTKGPGIKKDKKQEEMPIVNVAAMVLYALGVPVPQNMDGEVPRHLFDEIHLKNNPIVHMNYSQLIESDEDLSNSKLINDAVIFDLESEKKMVEQLKMLGYLD